MEKIDSETMKKIQIDMLKYIDEVCENNNIEYCLIGGSLIGAIRHNGFIPWDDDIDIAMTHDNYIKFFKILTTTSNDRYKIMDYSNNIECFYPFGKLIDTYTLMNEVNYKKIMDYGVYIDIFSYFYLPKDKKIRERHYKKVINLQRQIYCWSLINPYNSTKLKNLLKIPVVVYSKIKGINRILKQYNKLLLKYNDEPSEYVMSNWPTYKMHKEIQKITSITGTVKHKFENLYVSIPKNYDDFLKNTFGNYMELPPEKDRVPRHINEIYWKDENERN